MRLTGFGLLLALLLAGCGLGSPRLEGTLQDAESGQPVALAQVRVGEQVATTDEQGGFRVDLEVGDYDAIVGAPGYLDDVRPFSLTSAEKVYTLDISLMPRLLEGRITVADTAEPMAGVSVAYGSDVYLTDEGGRFSIPAREVRDVVVTGRGIVPATVPAADVQALFAEDGSQTDRWRSP